MKTISKQKTQTAALTPRARELINKLRRNKRFSNKKALDGLSWFLGPEERSRLFSLLDY